MWYFPSKYCYAMCKCSNVMSFYVCVKVHNIIICRSITEHYSDSKLCWTIKILIIWKFRSCVDSEDYAGIHIYCCVSDVTNTTLNSLCVKKWYAAPRETGSWSKFFFGINELSYAKKKGFQTIFGFSSISRQNNNKI